VETREQAHEDRTRVDAAVRRLAEAADELHAALSEEEAAPAHVVAGFAGRDALSAVSWALVTFERGDFGVELVEDAAHALEQLTNIKMAWAELTREFNRDNGRR